VSYLVVRFDITDLSEPETEILSAAARLLYRRSAQAQVTSDIVEIGPRADDERTLEAVRDAIDRVRGSHNRPRNGSSSDAYHLLADVAERALTLVGADVLTDLPALPERCKACHWTKGMNFGCQTCDEERQR